MMEESNIALLLILLIILVERRAECDEYYD